MSHYMRPCSLGCSLRNQSVSFPLIFISTTSTSDFEYYFLLGTHSEKNYGIIWEFFPNGGPPPCFPPRNERNLACKKTLGQFTKVLGIGKTPPPPMGKIPKKSRNFFLSAYLSSLAAVNDFRAASPENFSHRWTHIVKKIRQGELNWNNKSLGFHL